MANIDVVQQAYDAFNRRDLDGFLDLLAPDVEVYQTTELPWGGRYHGADGVREYLRGILNHVDSTAVPEELFEAGERVVEIGRGRGRARTTGREFDLRGMHVWELRDSRIVRLETYIDTPALLRAMIP